MSLACNASQPPADEHIHRVRQCPGEGAGLTFSGFFDPLHNAVGQRSEDGTLHDFIEPQHASGHGSGEQAQHLTADIGQCLLERLPVLFGLGGGQHVQVGAVALHVPLGHCVRHQWRSSRRHFDRQLQTVQVRFGERAAKTVIQHPRQPRQPFGPWLSPQQFVKEPQVFERQLPDKPAQLPLAVILLELLHELLEHGTYVRMP